MANESSRPKMEIYDHEGNEIDIIEPAMRLAEAIQDLTQRGFGTVALRHELGIVGGLTWYNAERVRNSSFAERLGEILDRVGVPVNFNPDL